MFGQDSRAKLKKTSRYFLVLEILNHDVILYPWIKTVKLQTNSKVEKLVYANLYFDVSQAPSSLLKKSVT